MEDLLEEEEEEEEDPALGVAEEDRDPGQFGAICPGCWQAKQTIGLFGLYTDRFGVEVEEAADALRFRVGADFCDLFTSAIALAICFSSPVSC